MIDEQQPLPSAVVPQGSLDILVRQALHLHQQGALPSAEGLYRRILHHQPHHAEALHGLGLLAAEAGQYGLAATLIQRAIASQNTVPQFHNNLGIILMRQGHLAAAANAYRQVIRLQPEIAEAHCNLALVLHEQGQREAARAAYHAALALNPDSVEAHNNLGVLCKESGDLEAARTHCEMVLRLRPDLAEGHYNLGTVLQAQQEYTAAIAAYRAALTLQPDHVNAQINLGTVLKDEGHLEAAEAAYSAALRLRPDEAGAHCNRAFVQLAQSKLAQGWAAYEWRWRTAKQSPRPFPQPLWEGTALTDRTILVHAEQGVGDELLFASCLPEVIGQARQCIIECDPRLAALFARAFPTAIVHGGLRRDLRWLADMPTIDVQIPFGSLPRYYRPSLGYFPERCGYLVPDAVRRELWCQRLAVFGPGLKVGLAWRSRLMTGHRRASYTSLTQWGPLLTLPGVHWVNLQYDECAAELAEARQRWGVSIHTWEELDLFHDLDGVAALIAALDLVIVPETAVTALAGSIGQPGWQFSPYQGKWDALGTEVSPWFPSMRVFRQPRRGDWDSVIQLAARELALLVAQDGGATQGAEYDRQ
jgi:tetratricopeptide (TPR) repeat protein